MVVNQWNPVYLALLNLEFVAVDDTLYNEVAAITKAMGLTHKGPPKDERAMEKARLGIQGKYNEILRRIYCLSTYCDGMRSCRIYI